VRRLTPWVRARSDMFSDVGIGVDVIAHVPRDRRNGEPEFLGAVTMTSPADNQIR
jgi:hypothetical protein